MHSFCSENVSIIQISKNSKVIFPKEKGPNCENSDLKGLQLGCGALWKGH
jgi:hypothetical protein